MKKALIFDCDNTLWQGIVGEGEITHNKGLYQDIVFYANHGVIIGLCSKNNEQDVWDALEGQALTKDYISVSRINWKDKVSNLKEIAQELNIGMDAIVFVDDSPFEVNLVKNELPDILSIYPYQLTEVISESFNLTGSILKTKQYKENYQRAKAQEQFADINDYLESLDMILNIRINESAHIPRIAELTQKTNQFNLTTERHTEEEIEYLMHVGLVYSLSVKDRFGDSGITGVCIIMPWDNPFFAIFETFLLSCRILGRGIEYAFMDYVMEDLKKRKYEEAFAPFIATKKNSQVADFYPNLGFDNAQKEGNEIDYSINIFDYKKHAANHFKYE